MKITPGLHTGAAPVRQDSSVPSSSDPVETVSLGGRSPAPLLKPTLFRAPASQDEGPIRDINRPGERVDLEGHLVPGKTNIICFWATWCPWSQQAQPKLRKLCEEKPEFVCLRVDIDNFESPAALQHGIRKVPSYAIYGPEGKLVSSGEEARARVKELFGENPA